LQEPTIDGTENNMEDSLHKYFSEMGKKSANRLTPTQRKKRAKKAVAQRWVNYRARKLQELKNE
jgi:hypothetical protein